MYSDNFFLHKKERKSSLRVYNFIWTAEVWYAYYARVTASCFGNASVFFMVLLGGKKPLKIIAIISREYATVFFSSRNFVGINLNVEISDSFCENLTKAESQKDS